MIAPQDAVLVEIGDRIQAGAERRLELGEPGLRGRPARSGSKRGLEQLRPAWRASAGIAGQRLLHVGLAERDADLQQVLAVGAQHRDLAPVQAGASTSWLKPSLSTSPRQTRAKASWKAPRT